jgi:hypothetical protein
LTAEDRELRKPSKKHRQFRKRKKVQYPQHEEGIMCIRGSEREKYRKYDLLDTLDEEDEDVGSC